MRMQHRHLETLPGLLSMNKTHEITTLGGGCFWCLEAVFSELRGVEDVIRAVRRMHGLEAGS